MASGDDVPYRSSSDAALPEAGILFSKEKRRTALLLGSSSRRERLEIQADLLAGKIDIIFGTHSLIQETVQFKNLALALSTNNTNSVFASESN